MCSQNYSVDTQAAGSIVRTGHGPIAKYRLNKFRWIACLQIYQAIANFCVKNGCLEESYPSSGNGETVSEPELTHSQCFPGRAANKTACLLCCWGQKRNTFLTAQGNEALCCRFVWRDSDRKEKATGDYLNWVAASPWWLAAFKSRPHSSSLTWR